MNTKEWISLTDLEILELSKATGLYGSDNHYEVIEFVAQIEQKLRQKQEGKNETL